MKSTWLLNKTVQLKTFENVKKKEHNVIHKGYMVLLYHIKLDFVSQQQPLHLRMLV